MLDVKIAYSEPGIEIAEPINRAMMAVHKAAGITVALVRQPWRFN
jgi:hypothetical protein